jgi:hypothetical protein
MRCVVEDLGERVSDRKVLRKHIYGSCSHHFSQGPVPVTNQKLSSVVVWMHSGCTCSPRELYFTSLTADFLGVPFYIFRCFPHSPTYKRKLILHSRPHPTATITLILTHPRTRTPAPTPTCTRIHLHSFVLRAAFNAGALSGTFSTRPKERSAAI